MHLSDTTRQFIADEVTEKLDRIAAVALRAKPVA
jgi:hypothetical protein